MFFYKHNNNYLFSLEEYNNLKNITEEEVKNHKGIIYFLGKLDPYKSRRSFSISDPSLLFLEREDINLLRKNSINENLPNWILNKIDDREITFINTNYPNWENALPFDKPKKWNINLIGIGDVGSTLLMGLRLTGYDLIDKIGIYSRNENKIKRWEYELNQVLPPFTDREYPEVIGISKDNLFDCDMFVFCASKGVPKVGSNVKDVRMIQFENNSNIIREYAKLARDNSFKGIFAVVSDPVDLLSKVALLESNKDESGTLDLNGLAPEQIRGYGLGVMNARASYYAKKDNKTCHYLKEGRAFGPHGEGLIIADSITNYNEELSSYLTKSAKEANLAVRDTGYKPYIAPALSSGALSIIDTIKGKWNYSATYMGGIFMGAKNRLNNSGIEIERLALPDVLFNKIENTYKRLGEII
ncbi:lactate/malate family dehydrogenase [Dethiothermospora halolimnae]|uniref:lactate/malate family dehydrogenase n=1 Tax=Dethiothermospora halolimnae TaxID=3114390 RepID=UPI003CCB8A74